MSLKNRSKHEDTLVNKITTFGRRRKIKEAEEVENLVKDGVFALEAPNLPQTNDIPPSEYVLDENEERCMIDPKSKEDVKLKSLLNIIIDWINDELSQERILVRNLEEDLFDGQVLGKLIEKIANIKLDMPEVTQTEEGRRHKLKIVLAAINHVLDLKYNQSLWPVEAIRSKDLMAILRLCLVLAFKFAPAEVSRNLGLVERPGQNFSFNSRQPLFVRPPEPLNVTILVVRKEHGLLKTRRHVIDIIGSAYQILHPFGPINDDPNEPINDGDDTIDYHLLGNPRGTTEGIYKHHNQLQDQYASSLKRDAFDTLFEHAPEKLGVVQKSLLTFARKHLNALDMDVDDLIQFHDGVMFIMLLSQLEGYFIPLHVYAYQPVNEQDKVQNMVLVLDLIEESGISRPKISPEEIAINKDPKSIMRLLYALFVKYKHL